MDNETENQNVVRAYALVGKCATGFSALEFHTQFLLSLLAFGKVATVEMVILMDKKTWADKILAIRRLAETRKQFFPATVDEIYLICDELDALRARRNLFIHGFWLINEFLVMDNMVRCSDTKWRYDKTQSAWTSMDTEDIPIPDLEQLARRIGSIMERMHKTNSAIELFLAQQQVKAQQP